MRYPPDEAADEAAIRRRGHQSGPHPGRQDASVFVPGYDSRREPGPEPGDSGGPGHPRWQGSAAGKGPVRGYPPLPGQPAPMYPPGQFAAWNSRGQGPARRAAAGGPASQSRRAGPAGEAEGTGTGTHGYYSRDSGDSGAHTDPGYSALAVSDPAADVTSTQTWQAVGDGRATGTWTPSARPAGPGPAGSRHARPGADESVRQPAGADGRDRGLAPWSAQAAAQPAGTTDRMSRETDQPGPQPGHTAPRLRPDGGRTGSADGNGAGRPGSALRPEPADRTGRSRSGRRPAVRRGRSAPSAKLAVAGALAIVLIAGIALYLGARALGQHHGAAGTALGKVPATVAPTPTPTLGPDGYIGSRRGDPHPLTVAELYPASFTTASVTFTRTKSSLSSDCVDSVSGAGIQGAVSAASCTQVARATYLAAKTGMMGTIGVLNLQTSKGASKAARAAGASDFIAQLAGRKAPTSKIGHGRGIEEALAKGHYLILIWAELTSLKTPRKGAQTAGLAQFMTELLDNTANVSLTDRMMSGSPSPAVSRG